MSNLAILVPGQTEPELPKPNQSGRKTTCESARRDVTHAVNVFQKNEENTWKLENLPIVLSQEVKI